MSNEIVKIHNDLTNEKLGKMNAKELDLFIAICHKMKNKGSQEVVLSFDELRKLGNYSENSNERLKRMLIGANEKLLSFVIQFDKGDETVQRTLFKEFRTNANAGTLTIELWEETAYILTNISKNFNRFELSEFVSLTGKYAKRLYKLLKQYRTQGYYSASKEALYAALDVPKSYKNTDFNKRVLKPALEECSKYIVGLTYQVERKGRGGAISKYTFSFNKEAVESVRSREMSEQEKIEYDRMTKNSKQLSFYSTSKRNKFNDFEQVDYDFAAIEKLSE